MRSFVLVTLCLCILAFVLIDVKAGVVGEKPELDVIETDKNNKHKKFFDKLTNTGKQS